MRDTQRGRDPGRGRGRLLAGSLMRDSIAGPGVMIWAEGRRSTAEPPRRPLSNDYEWKILYDIPLLETRWWFFSLRFKRKCKLPRAYEVLSGSYLTLKPTSRPLCLPLFQPQQPSCYSLSTVGSFSHWGIYPSVFHCWGLPGWARSQVSTQIHFFGGSLILLHFLVFSSLSFSFLHST